MKRFMKIFDYCNVMYRRILAMSPVFQDLIQRYLLRRLIKYSIKNVPFYRENYRGNASINELPIVNKELIRKDYYSFASDKINRMIYFKSYTGGSTGEPFMLLNQSMVDGYFQKRLWRRMGYRKGDSILALDGSSISDDSLKNQIYWKQKSKKDLPYGRFALSSLYLKDDNIQIYVNYIIEFKPSFIRGYPSFVYTIACYLFDNGIVIESLKGIQLTSETPFDYQISKIKEAFKCDVALQYGHTESAIFAYATGDEYCYSFEPLYGFLEVIKDDGTKAMAGEIGEIVVTSLHNYAMPLIRYRTGDLAIQSNHKNTVKKIIGRTQDYIIGRGGERIILTALIFAQHFKALENIAKWHIIQTESGKVQILLIKGKNYSDVDKQEILKLFLEKGNVEADLIYVTEIPLTQRGKSLMLTQNLKV